MPYGQNIYCEIICEIICFPNFHPNLGGEHVVMLVITLYITTCRVQMRGKYDWGGGYFTKCLVAGFRVKKLEPNRSKVL